MRNLCISTDVVSEPTILYSCNFTTCVLNCSGLGSQPQFTWTDNMGGGALESEWVVQRSEHLDSVFTCNSSNAVSWKIKSISEKDLFPGE